MASKFEVARNYELGGSSVFGCSTLSGLIRTINQDTKSMREGGDCQGLGYEMQISSAIALGLQELEFGGWLIPGTEITVQVTE